jgi:hypothetical protein
VQVPDEDGLLIVIERAAMVVLDFLAGVPVTVRQSPIATALTVSVAVSENVVDAVQLTDVCPAVVLCTSMVVPEIEATLPLAAVPEGAVAASAPTDIPITTAAPSAAITTGPVQRPSPRLLRGVRSMLLVVSLVFCATYSLLRASMGAR